jgi:hypothetical protein
MKLFAAICGTAGLVTAAVTYLILSKFAARYDHLETPLPALTQVLLWQGGMMPPALLLASAIAVFTGLARKNNRLMVAGGVSTILLMLGAATVVPSALLLPLDNALHGGDSGVTRPKPAAPPVEKDSIRD